jgi:hypothetical protein
MHGSWGSLRAEARRATTSPAVSNDARSHGPWSEVALYPPYVQEGAERRRWRLATRAALAAYGYQPGEALDRLDRSVIWTAQRSIYQSDIPTGDGDLAQAEVCWLRDLGL